MRLSRYVLIVAPVVVAICVAALASPVEAGQGSDSGAGLRPGLRIGLRTGLDTDLGMGLATGLGTDLGTGSGTAMLPSREIVDAMGESALRSLVEEVLTRNPRIASAEAAARAATERTGWVGSLPDPTASVGSFLKPPETRTGPQRISLTVSQRLPWLGKLDHRRRASEWTAAALAADAEALRLKLVTETRRLAHELGFLGEERRILESFWTHLVQHEEIARARYSAGAGSGHGVVKLQAELTRVRSRLLALETKQVTLVSRLNAMRDRPANHGLESIPLLDPRAVEVNVDELVPRALRKRPEMAGAEARIESASSQREIAALARRPDFSVELSYTIVDRRDDAAGLALPPEGNGDDIFGISGGVTLPLRRDSIQSAVAESDEIYLAAVEAGRTEESVIRAEVDGLSRQLRLSIRNFRLIGELLIAQAEEALKLAEAAYVSGNLNALDLLDSEHVLFEARVSRARAATDALVGLAALEGAVAGPIHGADDGEKD